VGSCPQVLHVSFSCFPSVSPTLVLNFIGRLGGKLGVFVRNLRTMEVVDWFTGNVSESSCASSPGLCRIIKRPLLSGCCYVIKLFWASLGTDLLHSARRSWFSRAVKLKVVRTCSWCRVVTT